MTERKPQQAHNPTITRQLVADQLMAGCTCGWRKPVSLWDYPDEQAASQRCTELWSDHLKEALRP